MSGTASIMVARLSRAVFCLVLCMSPLGCKPTEVPVGVVLHINDIAHAFVPNEDAPEWVVRDISYVELSSREWFRSYDSLSAVWAAPDSNAGLYYALIDSVGARPLRPDDLDGVIVLGGAWRCYREGLLDEQGQPVLEGGKDERCQSASAPLERLMVSPSQPFTITWESRPVTLGTGPEQLAYAFDGIVFPTRGVNDPALEIPAFRGRLIRFVNGIPTDTAIVAFGRPYIH